MIGYNYKTYWAHRLAWFLYYGEDPGEALIDHIDRDPTNNSIDNLRKSDKVLNGHNRDAKGYRRNRWNRYEARIYLNGIQTHLGSYATAAEARQAYLEAKSQIL